ncbi:MAG: Sensory box histidine kinase/response regulator [Myxococcales bacterium]|nr:Sensory box histidine kinase/response regulator [Myxococcales bacterium]
MSDRVAEGLTWESTGVEARVGALISAASEVGIAVSLVSLAGPEPRIVYVSDKGVEIFGRTREEIMARSTISLLTPPERVARESIGSRVHEERTARSFETIVARPDGVEVPVEVSLAPIHLDGGPGLIAFTRDITERRSAIEALARSEKRFRQLVEAAPDAVFINDGRRLVFANPAAARMLRYPDVASLLAIDPRTLFAPEELVLMRERSQQMIRTGRGLPPIDYPTKRSDGTWVLTEVQSMPIEWEGHPAILGFARDVTQRKEIEARLAQSERLAALGTLLAGIAHEMNNPLSYTLLGIEQALEATKGAAIPSDVAAKLAEALEGARHGASRVAAVIGQIRASSRRDAEDQGSVALREVVEAALRVTQNEVHHRARLVTDFGDVPMIVGSSQRLEQVFLNLLVNAVQALPDGRAENEIRVVLRPGSSGEAIVEISDNGPGISEDVRSRIFDPFFTTKSVGLGLGLGLSICHGIVTAHGGTIGVTSDGARGSTFRVVFPSLARSAAVVTAPATAAAAEIRPGRRRRVLVIDDEPTLATMIRRVLARDCDVTIARDGREGVAALTGGETFDVILCDLMMPDLTGMDVYAEISRLRPGLEESFIFMTGGAFTERATEFLERIKNRRLEKPFETSVLRAAVAAGD